MSSIVKKQLVIFAVLTSVFGSSSWADSTWLGNVQIRLAHRGMVSTSQFVGQAIVDNIADYNDFTISFDFYQAGVTDVPGTVVWQNVNAQAQLIQDDTHRVIKSGSIEVIGSSGNNVVYGFDLQQFTPNTVFNLDPELQNRQTMKTHLNILMNNAKLVSIPIDFSYQP